MVWAGTTIVNTEVPKDMDILKSTGAGLMRPLEESARSMKDIKILLEHKLTRIIREKHLEGDVAGIEAIHKGKKVYLRAKKGRHRRLRRSQGQRPTPPAVGPQADGHLPGGRGTLHLSQRGRNYRGARRSGPS